MPVIITRRRVLESVGLLPGKPPILGQGVKVSINSKRTAQTNRVWDNGDEAIVIRRFPYSGLHEVIPDDDLYEVQLTAKDSPRLYFQYKELELV